MTIDRPTLLGLILLASSSPSFAQERIEADYETVAPILAKYCAACHNDDDRDGDFSVESHASLLAGTEEGPVIKAGDADGSRMFRLLTAAAKPRMPPRDQPSPTASEIRVIRAWINAGANGPRIPSTPANRLPVPNLPAIQPRTDRRPITAIDLAPEGRFLAVGRFGEVGLIPLNPDGSAREPSRKIGPVSGKVTAVHFSRDGSNLVTASGTPGVGGFASLWNVETGEKIRDFGGHRDQVHDAELSPDGRTLATCGYDGRIFLFDTEGQAEPRRLDGHNGPVHDVAFSPDSQFLLSASADDTCKVWRVVDGDRIDTLPQPLKEVYGCLFHPDGRSMLAIGADQTIRSWGFPAREGVHPVIRSRYAHDGPILRAVLSRDGQTLVTSGADRVLKAWRTTDLDELAAWPDQPEIAVALAMTPDGSAFHVGRLDGSLARFEIPTDRQSETVPNGPAPLVANAPQREPVRIAEAEPNQTAAEAQTIPVPCLIRGTIQGRPGGVPDFDLYRFQARAGEEWVIEVDAARSKSPLDSFIEVLDPTGNRLERARLQAVQDSYFTFRGKDDRVVDDFRMFNWEEMKRDQYLYANGEVVKLWLYPRGPDSGFMVYPGQGRRWGWFDTTPLAHPLGEPAYIVQPHPPGTLLKPNGLPVFSVYFENDDEARRTLGKDSRLQFRAPADGEYLARIRDVRGQEGADFQYSLTIRPRQPDFRVRLEGINPTLGPGGTREFKVLVDRFDDFDGPIRVEIDGLPRGIRSTSPIEIEAGQVEGLGALTADERPESLATGKVIAIATIRGQEVRQEVNNLGEIRWTDKAPPTLTILPMEGEATTITIRPGETIPLRVRVDRTALRGQVPFGKEGAGRNLPFGVVVDNLGLNGLLILEDQSERTFFITADSQVPEQTRWFHLTTSAGGGLSTRPIRLHVRP